MFWVLVVLCIVIFIVWIKRKKNNNRNHKRVNVHVNQQYHSKEGNFVVKGTKNKFKIQKDNGLIFTVVDGQIVSITDKKDRHTYEVK